MTTINTTTMNTNLDDIIRNELISEGDVGKKTKVYKKIAGLTNLGRTYFVSGKEVSEKNTWSQAQMAQKFGAEIYGVSGQQGSIRSTDKGSGTASGTTSGSIGQVNPSGSGLINCTCSSFMVVPEKFVESSQDGYGALEAEWKKFTEFYNGRDDEWKKGKEKEFKEMDTLFRQQIKPNGGASQKDNASAWQKILKTMKKWNDELKKDSDWMKVSKSLAAAWKHWENPTSSSGSGGGGGGGVGGNDIAKSEGDDWNPNYSFRIDVQTNFDESWFQRKFKSGFLNKALMYVRTQAAKKLTDNDHKFTANEMRPGDERKLNSIQWKMTNKVAKSYITYLLGWSRNKELDANGVPKGELKMNSGFGASMAKKALSNRGILGRLAQKIFSGGQANNVISVAFQLADPNDGWKRDKPEDKPQDDGNEGGGGDAGAVDKQPKKADKPAKAEPPKKNSGGSGSGEEEGGGGQPVSESTSRRILTERYEFTISMDDGHVESLVNECVDELMTEDMVLQMVDENGNWASAAGDLILEHMRK